MVPMKRSTLITAPAIAPPSVDDDDDSDAVVMATVGMASTVIPSAVDAASAELSLVESESDTAAAVVDEGTVITAVMRTEAAVTVIFTSDARTPAAEATLAFRSDVSE